MPYSFSATHKTKFKKQGAGQAAWTATTPDKATRTQRVIHGVTTEICAATSEPKKIASHKEASLKSAIKVLKDAGLMFEDTDVKKFRVVLYGGNGDTLPSRGMVYFEEVTDTKPCVLLQLGNRVSKHVTRDMSCPQNAGGINIVGGARTRPPRVIADRIYDYYKSTRTVDEKEKCALNQTLHELGHIIHQLTSPDDYWLNAAVAGGDDPMANFQRQTEFDSIRDRGLRYVSQYAGTDAKSLNEFVAEVFAGLLMGIPWSQIDTSGKLMTTYVSLGGPIPPNPPSTISRLDDFRNVTCNCTANSFGEAFVYW